jgi:hypothetical protein
LTNPKDNNDIVLELLKEAFLLLNDFNIPEDEVIKRAELWTDRACNYFREFYHIDIGEGLN